MDPYRSTIVPITAIMQFVGLFCAILGIKLNSFGSNSPLD